MIKGEGVAYRGRVLFEIQTNLGELPAESIADIKHTEVVRVESYLRRSKYKLNAAFYDATMISLFEKPIEFEISIGKKMVLNLRLKLKNSTLRFTKSIN